MPPITLGVGVVTGEGTILTLDTFERALTVGTEVGATQTPPLLITTFDTLLFALKLLITDTWDTFPFFVLILAFFIAVLDGDETCIL